MNKQKETVTVRVKVETKEKLESLLKYGESFNDGLEMILWIIQRVGYRGLSGIIGNRQVTPKFTEEQEEEIKKRLTSKLGA